MQRRQRATSREARIAVDPHECEIDAVVLMLASVPSDISERCGRLLSRGRVVSLQ